MTRPPLRGALVLAACALAFAPVANSRGDDRVIAESGRSAYRIVLPAGADAVLQNAAGELQLTLLQMTGTTIPVAFDSQPATGPEIVVGPSSRLAALGVTLDPAKLGAEGYVIRTVGPNVVLAGTGPRGTPYAVMGLLTDHLGCRYFSPDFSRISKVERLVISDVEETIVPTLEYREPYTFEAFDGAWAWRNRMNSASARFEPHHGGRVRFADGFFVHTFERLVPPSKYFRDHPEYFSLVGGQRQDGYAQLCCTNEDVIRLCIEGVRDAMRAQPDATVFSVSQNDTFKFCECDRCQALAQAEGSQMAPVLALVNRVAEAVEAEFPDKLVETLAYQWTRTPPKSLRPRQNVIIRLCSIECCFAHPLDGCDSKENRAFVADLKGWSKVSDRLWVWDYVTDFAHYLMPFPNQRVRDDNIRLFVAHHVTGIFEQDTYNTPASELAELGMYLTARFLWNPNADEAEETAAFLDAAYGPAAAPIKQYLDLIHDHAERKSIHVHIFDPPSESLFPDDLLVKADALWQQAEQVASGDGAFTHRVQRDRMSLDYVLMERARDEAPGSPVRELARRRLPTYLADLARFGVTRLREAQPLNLDAYRADLTRVLEPAR